MAASPGKVIRRSVPLPRQTPKQSCSHQVLRSDIVCLVSRRVGLLRQHFPSWFCRRYWSLPGCAHTATPFVQITFPRLLVITTIDSGPNYTFDQEYYSLGKTLRSRMSYPSAMTTLINNPQLRLLNALRANSKPIMTFMGLPSFRTAQVVAQTGVDVSSSC